MICRIVILDFAALSVLAVVYLANAPSDTTKPKAIAALVLSLLGTISIGCFVPLSYLELSGFVIPGPFEGSTTRDAPSQVRQYIELNFGCIADMSGANAGSSLVYVGCLGLPPAVYGA